MKIPFGLNRLFIHLALIVITGLLVYSNTFDVPFHFDDKEYIKSNPLIRSFPYSTDPSEIGGMDLRRSIRMSLETRYMGYQSFALNYALDGLDVAGYHALNLAIHLLTTVLLYLLVVLTFRAPRLGAPVLQEHSRHVALFTALLFVAHPVQVEAVTYLCQRFASLAALFCIASLAAYAKSRLSAGKAREYLFYVLALACAVLAMKTKEIAFTLPVLIVLYEVMCFDGTGKKRLLALAPFVLTMLIIPLSIVDAQMPLSEAVELATKTQEAITRHSYLATEARVILTYLRLLVFPVNQNLDYDYPIYGSFLEPPVLASSIFLMALLGLGVYLFFRSRERDHMLRLASFGVLWFFVTLSVESSVVALSDVIFEHRLYLPSPGAFIAFTALAYYAADKFKGRAPGAAAASLAILVVLFSYMSYSRNAVWQSEISLWQDVARKSPGKARVYVNLGSAYQDEGMAEEAVRWYEAGLMLDPNSAQIHKNLGALYASMGRPDLSEKHFEEALKISPAYEGVYLEAGNISMKEGRLEEAIEYYLQALRTNPNLAGIHLNLGLAYYEKGDYGQAERYLLAAQGRDPSLAEACHVLGNIYKARGQTGKAIEQYERALRLDPGIADIHYSLGIIYGPGGELEKAIGHFEAALKLDPSLAGARQNLGTAYLMKGLVGKAIEQYLGALQADPGNAEVHYNLSQAYRRVGNNAAADEHMRKALSLKPGLGR